MKKRSTLARSCVLIAVIIICLGALLAGWLLGDLPKRAERVFGPPKASLSLQQRIYLSARLLLEENELKASLNNSGAERSFQIELGESPYSIANRLQEEGFIASAEALRDYLVYSGLDVTIQAGDYQLSPGQTAVQIAQALQDSTPTTVTFHILSGWRMEEIAASLPTSGLTFTPEEFEEAVTSPPDVSPLVKQLPQGASLEGFLYPDSYELPRQIPLDDFLTTLLDDFQSKMDYGMQEGFKNQGLSLYQAVILASIVQREAMVEDEMPAIASVFFNRLKKGMNLDSDPTVQYALGYDAATKAWWKNPLSLDDLKVQSAYNTYQVPGLPPGPIDNPGLSALKAVAYPAQTPYYYFRAACDGSGRHTFSETFEQHQQNACP